MLKQAEGEPLLPLSEDGARGLSRFSAVIGVLVALAFWLASNPYKGIEHDARLYVLMAYHWLAQGSTRWIRGLFTVRRMTGVCFLPIWQPS